MGLHGFFDDPIVGLLVNMIGFAKNGELAAFSHRAFLSDQTEAMPEPGEQEPNKIG